MEITKDVLNEYELLSPFQNKNAGFSRWTFAVKHHREFFLKEFMNPIYPDDDSLSEKLRERRIRDCVDYANRKKKIYEAIGAASDGNLVRINEFFRCGSHYYLATKKIDEAGVKLDEIIKEDITSRILLCRGIAHSIMKLHEKGVVHSDLKDTNILIKRTQTGMLSGKVIDFDCAFFESDPPEDESDLGGDQIYLAPEACMFLCGEDVKLSCKIDVFSLGLLFHQYLTGMLPGFDASEYDYAHEAVLDDKELEIAVDIDPLLRELLAKMLLLDQDERIDMKSVFEELGKLVHGDLKEDDLGNTDSVNSGSSGYSGGYFFEAGDL